MTEAQREALARRITDKTHTVYINHAPFDLPTGYLYVVYEDLGCPGFHCGISPEGQVSS